MPKIKTADGVSLYYEEALAELFAAAKAGRWTAHKPPAMTP
jgi:hypothetical protein